MNEKEVTTALIEALRESHNEKASPMYYGKFSANFDFLKELERAKKGENPLPKKILFKKPYQEFLKIIADEKIDPKRLKELNELRHEVASNMMEASINSMRESINTSAEKKIKQEIAADRINRTQKINNLQNEFTTVKNDLENAKKTIKSLKNEPRRQHRTLMIVGYFSFTIVLLLVCYVIYWGLKVSPKISVELNIGELIGGTLVGIGSALAGGAYAIKTLGKTE